MSQTLKIIGIITCIVVLAAVAIFGYVAGRRHAPPPQVVQQTVIKHDTLTVRQIVYKHGNIIVKTDTIKYSDTSEVNSLYSLIEALSNQPVQTIENPAVQIPAPVHKWGLGPAIGGTYNFKSARVTPHLGLAVEYNKNEFMGLGGYDNGWTASLILRRRF